MTELFLELVFDLVGAVAEVFVEAYASSDTLACRIFWGIVIVVTAGVIWWELH